jgi:ATP adenylyltransferase
MDYLFSPWRYQYIKSAPARAEGCVFCSIAASDDDERDLVVHRGERNYVVLNRFPYTSGHAMVIPYEHLGDLESAPPETLSEMMRLAQRLEGTLRRLYRPDGVNLGMNVGKAAGAGVAGHIHLHTLPRWFADSNFMTVVGETRVLPEELAETWRRMCADFAERREG